MPVEGDSTAHWFELETLIDVPPGVMWNNTTDVFGIIEDARAALFVSADARGVPLLACLVQSWWQGYDDTAPGPAFEMGLGEDASLLSVIRFDRLGSAPGVPSANASMSEIEVGDLGLHVPVPVGWAAEWAEDGSVYWLWPGDDYTAGPSIRMSRRRVTDETLLLFRDSGATADDIADALAAHDAASALEGWQREPETIERAVVHQVGADKGDEVIPARLLTFRPELDGYGPRFGADVVFFAEPWSYLIQHLTPPGDELADRYRFERWLESLRVDV